MLFNFMATTGKGKTLIGSFLIFLILAFSHYAAGQTVILPVNEEGMVEYIGSVETDSLSYLMLWDNAMKFLSTQSVPDQLTKDIQINEGLTEMNHQFGFYLIVKPALTKQVDGVIMSDITIKIEGSKYEYKINNFRFIKYARDRFGKFVPKSSKKYPLEKYYPENDKKTWRAHFEAINSKIENMTTNLELNMAEIRKN